MPQDPMKPAPDKPTDEPPAARNGGLSDPDARPREEATALTDTEASVERQPFPLPTRGRPTRPDAQPGDPHLDMAVDLRRGGGRSARGQSTVPSWDQFAALEARVAELEAVTPLRRGPDESDDDYIARAVNAGRVPEPGTYTLTKAVIVGG